MGLGATPFHILVCTSLQVPTTGTRIKYPWPGCSSILVRHLEQRGPGCRASSSAWATWLPGCKLLGTAATCPLPCTGSIKRSRKRSCSPPPAPCPAHAQKQSKVILVQKQGHWARLLSAVHYRASMLVNTLQPCQELALSRIMQLCLRVTHGSVVLLKYQRVADCASCTLQVTASCCPSTHAVPMYAHFMYTRILLSFGCVAVMERHCALQAPHAPILPGTSCS